jgi:hypothetical protein
MEHNPSWTWKICSSWEIRESLSILLRSNCLVQDAELILVPCNPIR